MEKKWLMICLDGVRIKMDDKERQRYVNRRTNSNRNWIVVTFDDGSEVMLDKVIAVLPNPKYVEPVNKEFEEMTKEEIETPIESKIVPAEEEEHPEKSIADKEKEMLDELMKKSACTHEGLEVLYKQATSKGERYFPLCSFCGHRGRYVKKDSLTAEDMANAKEYTN